MPIANCNAQAISADGQYIAGVIVETNGRYQPAIWKNGILERQREKRYEKQDKNSVPFPDHLEFLKKIMESE